MMHELNIQVWINWNGASELIVFRKFSHQISIKVVGKSVNFGGAIKFSC